MANEGAPTVILAKTIKGFGMGKSGEGLMSTHQQKKLSDDALKEVRDRFNIPISDEEIAGLTFRKPAEDSEEMRYLHARRRRSWRLFAGAQLGGCALDGAAARGIQRTARRARGARNIHHHGVGANADHPG